MKILHLLSGGNIGGIEMLCRDISELSHEQNEFCFLYSGGAMADEMEKKNVHVYRFYKENLFIRLYKLFRLVKVSGYDIVIVHHEGIGIYSFYLLLAYCFRKIKYIKYLHCSFEKKYFYSGKTGKDWLYYTILKRALYRSDCVVAVSEFVKKSYCVEFNYLPDKVKVIYNGIRIREKAERNIQIPDKDTITLLYIGRLVDEKGIALLLRAVKKLLDGGENVELEILGDGNKRQEYEAFSKELGIKDRVFFEGYQLQKQPFYDKSKIFVYPSICEEAFGISIVEAMGEEMMCVASDIGGIPEIIEDGKDGFLFRSGDVDSLTEAIRKAISCTKGQEYREIKMMAGRKSQKYDVTETIENLEDIFSRLVRDNQWKKN